MNHTFQKPFRVGKAQPRAVLDANGKEVVIFASGMEAWAKDYCDHLNSSAIMESDIDPVNTPDPNRLLTWLYIIFVAYPYFLYRYFTRKAFYVTGTFIDPNGVRMFFASSFCTWGHVMPIRSLQIELANQYGVEKVCILNFNRIPYGMVKYLEKEMDLKINTDLA